MSWEYTLKAKKDTWVPKRIGSKDNPVKPKVADRIIAVLKRNPSGLKFNAIMGADSWKWSAKRVRDFLKNHPDVQMIRQPQGATGNIKTLYYWRGN